MFELLATTSYPIFCFHQGCRQSVPKAVVEDFLDGPRLDTYEQELAEEARQQVGWAAAGRSVA